MIWFIVILTIPIVTIINGYVLKTLWFWFIVPTFGLAPLGLAASIGLAMIVSRLTFQVPPLDENQDGQKEALYQIAMGAILPLFSLGIGYIVHLFM